MAMFTGIAFTSEPAEESTQEWKYNLSQDHENDDTGKKREADMGQDPDTPDHRKETDRRIQYPSAFISVICQWCNYKNENEKTQHIPTSSGNKKDLYYDYYSHNKSLAL